MTEGHRRPTGREVGRLARHVAPASRRLGLRVFLVGGAVRDMLAGLEPAAEWDLVVTEPAGGAGRLAHDLAAQWWGRPPIGFPRFGTYMVQGPPGQVEISQAGLRSGIRIAGRDHLTADALTRDFTLNALYVDLRAAAVGKGSVLDPTGRGLRDLRLGVLRTPLSAKLTLGDDPLRILRAARLCAARGYSVAGDLGKAARACAPALSGVAAERLRDEMNRLLVAARPSKGLDRLAGWGAFAHFMPEVQSMIGFSQVTPHHYPDLFRHTMRVVDRCPPRLEVRWAALLHDCGKPTTSSWSGSAMTFHGHESRGAGMARDVLKRMRLGREVARRIEALVSLHMVHYTEEWTERAVRRLAARAGDLLPDLLALAAADAASLRIRAPKQKALAALRDRLDALEGRLQEPISPLDGRRIQELLEIGPGELVGRAKAFLASAVVDGRLSPDGLGAEDFLLRWWRVRAGKQSRPAPRGPGRRRA